MNGAMPVDAASGGSGHDSGLILHGAGDSAAGSSRLLGRKSKQRISPPTPAKTKRRCPYCPFTSYYAASITVHMRRHTGEKPYRCLHCNKSFRDKSNFNSHTKRFGHHARPKRLESSSNTRTNSVFHINNFDPKALENMPAPVPDMPVISHVYSQSVVDQPREDHHSAAQSYVGKNLSYPIMPKLNRRKAATTRKAPQPQHLRSASFSSESGSNELETSINVDNVDVFAKKQSDSDTTQERDVPTLLKMPRKPPETDGMHPYPEPPASQLLKKVNQSLHVNVATDGGASYGLYSCKHCGIHFENCILHTLHMGCHGFNDPFQCNTCGAKCRDAVEFHCHFARATHDGTL